MRSAWPSRRAGLAAVGTVAVLVLLTGLANGFAYDDVPLLVEDGRLHSWGTLPGRLAESWWPTGLFRPVSLALLGLEWLAGGGAPLVFRLVSTALYALVCMGVFQLARVGGVGSPAALAAGLLFAVHPVHVEVTANTVGQAELLSALFVLGTVLGYLSMRRRGGRAGAREVMGLALGTALAANAKESGYVVVPLLVAVECLLVADQRPWRRRWVELRPLGLVLLATVLASLLMRTRVLGALGGEIPHPALAPLSPGERATAMLAVVPEWARLLLWPARLQAEYGPPGLVPETTVGAVHLLGLAVTIAMITATWWTRRRAPMVAFGLTWTAVALLPVANVLAPTGILLAERTMFLPSVGVVVAMAGALEVLGRRLADTGRLRMFAQASLGVLLVLAAIHSAARQPVWRDTLRLLSTTVEDAPDSYRARFMLGRELARLGREPAAEARYREAIALWPHEARPFEELGQLLRARGDCAAAIPVLEGGVRADSTSDIARSRLVECLIVERRWDEAEREIARGLAQGVQGYGLTLARISALRGEQR